MLWISEEGFSSGMNDCNISSFVTLILCVVVGFLASRPDSIPSFCFEFSGIALGFDPFILFWVLRHHAPSFCLRVLWHCARI